VVREYVGTGFLAELIAMRDASERRRRYTEAEEWCAERAAAVERRESVRAFCRLVDDAVAIELERLGFHEHKGEWRRWRI
jgi:hypothetical protein